MTITINAPDPKADGKSWFGPVEIEFKEGVAKVEELSDELRRYFTERGFGIDAPATPVETPAVTTLDGKPVDTRDLPDVVEGSPLRDAAVDPQPGDFLPPVNAGQADPHGPEVVAPEIHASGEYVVAPGPVGGVKTDDAGKPVVDLEDTDAQARHETDLAKAILVDQQPVHEATAAVAAQDVINADQPADDGPFDPSKHTVGEVKQYLASADETERQRVLDAEAAGKNRATITAPATPATDTAAPDAAAADAPDVAKHAAPDAPAGK